MRYRANRSLHYVDEEGQDRFVNEGDFVVKASPTKIDALLADGLITAVRSEKAKEA
jgi:hypothetical protein